jgi:hypothetical protein
MYLFIFLFSFLVSPVTVFGVKTIQELLMQILSIVSDLIVPLYTIALAVFLWGIVGFIRKDALGDKALDEAKKRMGWGIIILFVLTSVWGLVGMLGDFLDVGQGGQCNPTQITSGGVKSCLLP